MNIKRFLILVLTVLLVFSMIGSLTACGNNGECEGCGEEAKLKTVTFMGEKMELCKDCADEIKDYLK